MVPPTRSIFTCLLLFFLFSLPSPPSPCFSPSSILPSIPFSPVIYRSFFCYPISLSLLLFFISLFWLLPFIKFPFFSSVPSTPLSDSESKIIKHFLNNKHPKMLQKWNLKNLKFFVFRFL